jgi:DNA-binding IclR family transcriptional regulator
VHYPEKGAEPARYAAPVRDFRGIVLAAVELTLRPGQESAADGTLPATAVVSAANALSTELGFTG